jgi:predicted LPLAT superfamily acyltransferase
MTTNGLGHWRGRTSGGALVIACGARCIRILGQPGVLLLSLPVALLVLLVDASARRESMRYFRHLRPGVTGDVALGLAWRHFSAFGRVLCDRMLAYSDPQRMRIDFDEHGGERLRQAVGDPRGCLLVSAHLGNWELAGHLLQRLLPGHGPRAHIVMIESEDPAVRRLIRAHMGDHPPTLIDPREGFVASLAIRAALAAGDTVCMLADRAMPGQPTRSLPFLGRTAAFPLGPFQLAALTGCVVVPCFLLKRSRDQYALVVDQPWRIAADLPRAQRQAAIAEQLQRWVARLEAVLRRHPFQWHNFSNFWRPS